MATPDWIQKHNNQKADAARQAEASAQQQLQAADFLGKRGLGFFDRLALALQFNAQGLEKLEGEELWGNASKSVTSGSPEHNIYVRVERRSVKHGPEFVWLNLWYTPGNGSIRCWAMDQPKPNIELIVSGKPEIGQDILAMYDNLPLTADQMAERIVRSMAKRALQNKRRF